jgi:hypothetical protein
VPAQDLSSYVELITALEWQENLKDEKQEGKLKN